MTMEMVSDIPSDEGFDDAMEAFVEPTVDELQAVSLREHGFAVRVVRTDAQGIETEEFLAASDFVSAVAAETTRCSGRSNRYSDVSLMVTGERGAAMTETFAKVGPCGVLGLPLEQRASHHSRRR